MGDWQRLTQLNQVREALESRNLAPWLPDYQAIQERLDKACKCNCGWEEEHLEEARLLALSATLHVGALH